MKSLFATAALAGIIGLSAIAPAQAESARSVDGFRPHATVYSWGILVSPNDGPQTAYAWTEASQAAQPSAGSQGTDVDHETLIKRLPAGTSFSAYSWGIITSPSDGPATSYRWDELRQLAN